MPSFPVLAEANSKLHADIAIIRLLRAGLQPDQIVSFFPRNARPFSIDCWWSTVYPLPSDVTAPMAAAGSWGPALSQDFEGGANQDQLESLGFTAEMINRLREKLEDGRTVLGVQARTEAEAAIAWHVFEHVTADHLTESVNHEEWKWRENPVPAQHLAGVAA